MPTEIGAFLGSAEVEFESKDAAAAAVAADPALAWQGEPLRITTLADFREGRESKKRKKREEEAAEKRRKEEEKAAEREEAQKRKRAREEEEEAAAKKARIEQETSAAMARFGGRGLMIRLDGIPIGMTWQTIKNALDIYGGAAWVDYDDRQEGYLYVGEGDKKEIAVDEAEAGARPMVSGKQEET